MDMAQDMKTREIWESTIPGRVSLTVENSQGRPQTISIVGKGSRLRLTQLDRELAEEVIRTPENNPFRNGMLVRVDNGAGHVPSAEELSDDDLRAIFELDQSDFRATVDQLGQVNVRRLKSMVVEVDASKSEIEYLDEVIQEKWPIGGSMPTYDEMQPSAPPRR
jgi:hypothetical protein